VRTARPSWRTSGSPTGRVTAPLSPTAPGARRTTVERCPGTREEPGPWRRRRPGPSAPGCHGSPARRPAPAGPGRKPAGRRAAPAFLGEVEESAVARGGAGEGRRRPLAVRISRPSCVAGWRYGCLSDRRHATAMASSRTADRHRHPRRVAGWAARQRGRASSSLPHRSDPNATEPHRFPSRGPALASSAAAWSSACPARPLTGPPSRSPTRARSGYRLTLRNWFQRINR